MVGPATPGTCCPETVCCRLVRCLCGFLDEQSCCLLFVIVKCTEVCGSGGFDDLRQTRLQKLFREKARQDCFTDHTVNSRFSCDEGSQSEPEQRCLALS